VAPDEGMDARIRSQRARKVMYLIPDPDEKATGTAGRRRGRRFDRHRLRAEVGPGVKRYVRRQGR